jgi:hypothetical protein
LGPVTFILFAKPERRCEDASHSKALRAKCFGYPVLYQRFGQNFGHVLRMNIG